MPIIQSAKKDLRRSAKRRSQNNKHRRVMKDVVKEVRALAISQKAGEAKELLAGMHKAIDKAAKRGVIKPKTAARKKSRLTKLVNKASAE
jgi:small subunit ribosomal protein S20